MLLIAYLMRSFGNFENDVIPVLNTILFYACALKMTCVDLAKTFSYLANKGVSVQTKKEIITPVQTKQLNALFMTCGLYDGAGEFAYRVGMPGKSVLAVGLLRLFLAKWRSQCGLQNWTRRYSTSGNSGFRIVSSVLVALFLEERCEMRARTSSYRALRFEKDSYNKKGWPKANPYAILSNLEFESRISNLESRTTSLLQP